MLENQKLRIRKRILNSLKKQKEEDRLRKSLVIQDKLFSMPEFQHSKIILFYSSFDGEVETLTMMKEAQKLGKTIALPAIKKKDRELVPIAVDNLEKDLEPGPYAIPQPRITEAGRLRLEDMDMVIVPGVAFDKNNYRLGRGAGYYDRFLRNLSKKVLSVGLAFDFQVLDRLPIAEHDVPVSRVIAF